MAKITFQRERCVTGLARIAADLPSVNLKFKGQVFGRLVSPATSRLSSSPTDGWSISLMLQTAEHPGWKWARLKIRFATEEAGREWITANTVKLLGSFRLHLMAD